jgi:hypothetical protein
MTRLYILVEGDSEAAFVREQLRGHLWDSGVLAAGVRVTTRRDQRRGEVYKGGLSNYAKPKQDLERLRRQHNGRDARFTTMFDLFRLPNDFPGYDEAAAKPTGLARVEHLEMALAEDINDERFVPYIQLHEFEALLLAEPEWFGAYFLDDPGAAQKLVVELGAAPPEDINDGPSTAPSKRIIAHFPGYEAEKAAASMEIAEAIGLPHMRERCPHFAQWLAKLESLGSPSAAT